MAMRLFSKADFEKELVRAELVRTDITTATSRLWKAPNGAHITVPDHAAQYPDSILEDVLRQLGLLYHRPTAS